MPKSPRPSFDNPPVIEVVCGIQFQLLEKFTSPHFGLLWERFNEDYPNFKDMPPLVPQVLSQGGNVTFHLTDKPPLPRAWFIHKNESGIVQIQQDRFLHNWKKGGPQDKYPRYETVIALFKEHLGTFDSYVREKEIGAINPTQYEMTYVNHIPLGDGWTTLNDIGNIFEDFSWNATTKDFLPEISNVSFKVTFDLPDGCGRLHIKGWKGLIKEENLPVLRLDLTVQGMPQEKTEEGMWNWFDEAREWIVRGFADFTNKNMHGEFWRRHK